VKSKQDRVPTHCLGETMALDSQGRVLRKPFFFTKEEHEAEIRTQTQVSTRLITTERAQRRAAVNQYLDLLEEMERKRAPHIFVRRRLHGVVRWLIRVV